MDYLIEIIDDEMKNIRKKRIQSDEKVNLLDLFCNGDKIKISDANKKQPNMIIKGCENLKTKMNAIWQNENLTSTEKYTQAKELKQEYIDNIKSLSISSATIKKIIYDINNKVKEDSKNKNNMRNILSILYTTHKEEFIKLFEEQKEEFESIKRIYVKEKDIEIIKIYGMDYMAI
jgi:hypothetical protein